jgi:hypothetical protein
MPLSDPRRYGPADAAPPLLKLADGAHQHELSGALRELASGGRDLDIGRALAATSSSVEYARIWSALCAAIEKSPDSESVVARVFAIPWIIVCGADIPATVDCVLPNAGELVRVLEQYGVFGGSRNLGLSGVLCGIDALEALAPSEVLRGWENARIRDMPPAPIKVLQGVQEVHVRYSLGAAIAPAHAPDIVETGANIGAWGTPALRAMAAQLATPNVQLLPMPRQPAGLYTAAYAGRRAGLEAAFNLFMSNSVRRFRSAWGDPSVTLSTHASGEVRVTLWVPFDDAMTEGFRWPLHPADDLAEIERTIRSLIRDCRLAEAHVHRCILPDYTSSGAILFPREGVTDAAQLSQSGTDQGGA